MRLEAGRHHLRNGEKAVAKGYLEEGYAFFEAALLQFHSPELRVGEAHALRGLGQIAHRTGRLDDAEARLTAASRAYRELLDQLDRIDPERVAKALRDEACHGRADALRLLADVVSRSGRRDEASELLRAALAAVEPLGDVPLVADLWAAYGRLAARGGDYEDAEAHVLRAAKMHTDSGDHRGAVEAWLALADMRRVRGDRDEAEAALLQARGLSERLDDPRLKARLLYSLGAAMASSKRHDLARSFFTEALPKARQAEDVEMEGYALLGLGDVGSREQDPAALDHLLEGARALQRVEHAHGMATALLRIGEHGMRDGRSDLALAAARAAWGLSRTVDPVVGVGQALRVVVDALAALRAMKPALTAAIVRADLLGEQHPKVLQIASYYRSKAPPGWVAEVDAMSPDERVQRLGEYLDWVLRPILLRVDLSVRVLDDPSGAVEAIARLHAEDAAVNSPTTMG